MTFWSGQRAKATFSIEVLSCEKCGVEMPTTAFLCRVWFYRYGWEETAIASAAKQSAPSPIETLRRIIPRNGWETMMLRGTE